MEILWNKTNKTKQNKRLFIGLCVYLFILKKNETNNINPSFSSHIDSKIKIQTKATKKKKR